MNSHPTENQTFRPSLLRNWFVLAGLVLTIASVFAFVLLMVMDYSSGSENPYLGILTYVVAPGFFVLGVLIMMVGALIHRRHLIKAAPGARVPLLSIDFSSKRDRKLLFVFALGAAGFLLITSIGSYQTYHVTESVQFCGEACHTPMEPQFVTYHHSPHAKVPCTDCHVGPGATGFIQAKLNGTKQLYEVLANNYPRPIDGHDRIHINRKTCEQCHWPEKFVGDLDRTYTHFLTDTNNTPYSIRMVLKVGGSDPTHGPVGGIHWHMNFANKVEFIATDPQKQKIPWIRLTDSEGKVTIFKTAGFDEDPSKFTIRTMDCMDCHNRPAHQFMPPNDAVDHAMAIGTISLDLPAIKKQAVLALTEPYSSKEEALEKIAARLKEQYPGRNDLGPTIAAVQEIYGNNFFPAMKTDWRVHPNNIGHKDWAGCFRCHDDSHKSEEGRAVQSSNCNACHLILAEGPGRTFDSLNPAGQDFKHPIPDWDVLACADCHNGMVSEEKEEAAGDEK